MKHSESIKELATALAKAQGELEGAKKDSANPFFKSKYADLSSVVDAIKASFPTNGLSYVQTVVTAEHGVGVETMLMHSSGEWLRGEPFFIPVNKSDAQGFGSALTYARRYSLSAVAGIKAEDDDGNAAAKAAPNANNPFPAPITGQGVNQEEFDKLDAEAKDFVCGHARAILQIFSAKGDVFGYVEKQGFDQETLLALWSQLPSNVRSAIKKAKAEMNPPHQKEAA